MKKLIIILAILSGGCGSKEPRVKKALVIPDTTKSDSTKATVINTVSDVSYTNSKVNNHFQQCKYPELIRLVLEKKKEYDLTCADKTCLPAVGYSEWFHSLYNPEYTDEEITKYIERAIEGTIEYLAKTTEFNYVGIAAQDSSVKVYKGK